MGKNVDLSVIGKHFVLPKTQKCTEEDRTSRKYSHLRSWIKTNLDVFFIETLLKLINQLFKQLASN